MKILSIIPARGGSKGIKDKNIYLVQGKPLIQYTIDVSINSKLITKTIVSTDSPRISKISKILGAEVVTRPASLATDSSLVIDAMKHVIIEEQKSGFFYDYIVLLEPTSPLRTVKDLESTIKKVLDSDSDSGATFSETTTPPGRIWKINGHSPTPYIKDSDPFLPRQVQPKGYYLNGMVYVIKTANLFSAKNNSILQGKISANVIPNDRVIDIDKPEDILYFDFLLQSKK